jgi:hypothetical protein
MVNVMWPNLILFSAMAAAIVVGVVAVMRALRHQS